MRTRIAPLVIAFGLSLLATAALQAQSLSVEKLDHYNQTSAAAPVQTAVPYSFEVHVNKDTSSPSNFSQWGPAFYRPGGAAVEPQSGAPTSGFSTNTGTMNFAATPTSGSYFFQNNYTTQAAMDGYYGSGSYGINFLGTTPPSPNTVAGGLSFTGGGFAGVAPQVTAVNNSASWSSGVLKVLPTGSTTLTLNSGLFSQYSSSAFGAVVSATLYGPSGTPIDSVKSINGVLSYTDAVMGSYILNDALLTPGQTYKLEIQYGLLASAPGSTSINSLNFQGVAAYYENTGLSIVAVPEPEVSAMICGLAALGFVYQRRRRRGVSAV